jgi:DNA-binding NarL/FixJ family response regulator
MASLGQAGDVRGSVDVLIVDDQAPFRQVARTLVRLIPGWQVVGEAATGEDAVEQVAAALPAVVLMDINLPGMSGIEATRQIVSRAPQTSVVLVSSYAADDLPPDARDCGAVGYIRKDDLTPARLRAVRPTVPGEEVTTE